MRSVVKTATAKKATKRDTDRYVLVHVWGCVEPSLATKEAVGWNKFEEEILNFLKTDKTYDEEESGLFFIRLTSDGRLKNIGSFSGGFMDEMRQKAGLEPAI